jgi:hypothetical protein
MVPPSGQVLLGEVFHQIEPGFPGADNGPAEAQGGDDWNPNVPGFEPGGIGDTESVHWFSFLGPGDLGQVLHGLMQQVRLDLRALRKIATNDV